MLKHMVSLGDGDGDSDGDGDGDGDGDDVNATCARILYS